MELLKRVSPLLLLSVGAAVVIVFNMLAPYAHPSSDDLCLANGIQRDGLLKHLWLHYQQWSGRYSGNALYGTYPVIFGMFTGYKYIPVVLIISLIAASAFLLSSLFRLKIFDSRVLLPSLCFIAVFLLGMLSPASGLYWMAGALSYQPANIFLLIILGLMFRIAYAQKQQGEYEYTLIVLIIAMAIAIGFNETAMIALIAVSLLFVLLHLRAGWSVLWPWAIVLVTALVCFGVVYLSPGNEIRASEFQQGHNIGRAIRGSLDIGGRVLVIWISNPVLLIATLLVPFSVSRLYGASPRSFTISRRWVFAMVVLTLTIPFAFQFPAWWAMGGWAPARTIDAAYFVFLVSWFMTAGGICIYFMNSGKLIPDLGTHFPVNAIILLAISILFTITVLNSNSFKLAQLDRAKHAKPWHQYMQQRYALIDKAVNEGRSSLVVPDYDKTYPRTIYFNDIMHNSRDWRNICYAQYFGLQRIKRDKK